MITPNITITQASIEDAASVVNYLNTVAGETDFLTFGSGEFPLSIQEEAATISDGLENNTCLMLIAKLHGHIIAQLFMSISLLPRLAHIGDIGITVSKQYWGMSIGTHMIAMAITWAKKNQLTKLQLQVRADNLSAIHLYQKSGFNIEGTIARSVKINNMYFDAVVMGLLL